MRKKLSFVLASVLICLNLSFHVMAADYSSTDVIIKIQQALNEAGYDCGTPDGSAGKKTKAAVSSFRTDNNLTTGDTMDDELATALGLTDLVEASEEESGTTGITGDMNLSGDNCVLEFQKYGFVKDWDGKDAIGLYYQFTNNDSDSNNAMKLGYFELFQNGHSLDMTFSGFNDTELSELNKNLSENVKDGVSLPVVFLYEIQDTTSPIDIEITDFTTFDKRKARIEFGNSGPESENTESEQAKVEEAPETETPAVETQTEETLATEIQTEDTPATEVQTAETGVAETAQDAQWECPECGTVNAGNFCSNCGTPKPSSEWECPECGTVNAGNFCTNCGTPKDSVVNEIKETEAVVEETSAPQETEGQGEKTIKDYIKDYTGLNLASVGYTSISGDRRDYYGDSNLVLTLVTSDGIYVDPDDDEELQSYTVVSQAPAGGSEIIFYYDNEDDIINCSYSEIVLAVQKAGELGEAPQLTEIKPSVNKETQYMKDYVGRNLTTVGYTSLSGKRYDTFGSKDQRIQISITDEAGAVVDPDSGSKLQYYTVTSQNLEPNTELEFTYSMDSDGKYEITGQTVNTIQITAQMSEEGAQTLEQQAAEEAELRASGAMKDLYEGTYKIGTDLEPGCYKFMELNDSADAYIYQNEEAYNQDEGEWYFIYGADDAEYVALREGMYLKISGGAAKSIRSDFPAPDAEEMDLYQGIYRIGTDMAAGSYEFSHITDSCDVNIYQSEEDLQADNGDWDFLYGKDDKGYYTLRDGMIIKISGGAAHAVRNG